MYTVIAFIIITFIVVIIHNIKNYGTPEDVDDCFNLLLICLISSLITGVFGFATSIFLPVDYETISYKSNLNTLSDNSSVEGNFFLGSGQIDGTMQYACYIETNGYYKLITIDCEKALVKYSNEKPHIETIVIQASDEWYNKFGHERKDIKYVFHVPKGSIMNNYALDAK